jgi:hypothetical protein
MHLRYSLSVRPAAAGKELGVEHSTVSSVSSGSGTSHLTPEKEESKMTDLEDEQKSTVLKLTNVLDACWDLI